MRNFRSSVTGSVAESAGRGERSVKHVCMRRKIVCDVSFREKTYGENGNTSYIRGAVFEDANLLEVGTDGFIQGPIL